MAEDNCTIAHVLMFVERRLQGHYSKVMPYMRDIRNKVLARAVLLADEDGVIPDEFMWELFDDLALPPEEERNLGAWLRLDTEPIAVCTDGI